MDSDSEVDGYVDVTPPPSPRVWRPIPESPSMYYLDRLRCCYCDRIIRHCAPTDSLDNAVCIQCANSLDPKQRRITDFFRKK